MLQIYFSICVPKLLKYNAVGQSYCKKIKGCNFFAPQCIADRRYEKSAYSNKLYADGARSAKLRGLLKVDPSGATCSCCSLVMGACRQRHLTVTEHRCRCRTLSALYHDAGITNSSESDRMGI